MPYRHFNGTSDTIKFSRGACDFTGAVTILIHCLPDTGKAGQLAGIYESLNAAGELKNYGVYARETSPKLEIDNGEPSSEKVGTGPGGYFGEGEWSYLVVTKAAGTVKATWWGRVENKNEWVHGETSNTVPDALLMGSGGYMDIGGGGDGFFWAGGIASIARWDKALTQAEVEALGAISHLEELATKGPKGLWLLNQSSPSVPVPDRSGNGAGQISISGTTVVNAEPGVIGFAEAESGESPQVDVRRGGIFTPAPRRVKRTNEWVAA